MDSSIRPNVTQGLLGGLSWNAEDVRPIEWVTVIGTILQKHAGLIDYLPGYKPIKDRMNGWQGSKSNRPVTDMDDPGIVVMPAGFTPETKCVHLASVSHHVEGDAAAQHTFGYGARFVFVKDLFMTNKGRIVLSNRKYERVFTSAGQRAGETQQTDVTRLWVFYYCEDENLATILTPAIAINTIDSLGRLTREGVRERQMRLKHMEDFFTSLKGIKEKLGQGHWERWHKLWD